MGALKLWAPHHILFCVHVYTFVNILQENEIKTLFKYAQGTANVWDCHEVALTKAERQLVERLESTRKEHDGGNQEKEAQLDQQLDRLRQEATEPGLAESLKVVGSILDKIKER